MRRTFKYKVELNQKTKGQALKVLHLCRILYNTALEQRISIYKQSQKSISAYDQINQLPELKKAFPEFKQIPSQTAQDVIQRGDRAHKAFFRRLKAGEKPGFPRFKSFDRYDSFTLTQAGWNIQGKHLIIPKIGRFKVRWSRPITGIIKTVNIRKAASGRWFVCFSCDDVPKRIFPETTKEIGIDVGIKFFAVDTEGPEIKNPKFMDQSQKKLRRTQRSLARKKKGSNRRYDAKVQVARVHERITNQRNDFLHKKANKYIQNYSKIYVEGLQIRNMVKNHCLARSISDVAWGTFFQFLVYKAEEAGRQVMKVNPHGTSQRCSSCGQVVHKDLSVRVHSCPNCGLVIDRDLNAARNIKQAGQSCQALTSELLGVV